MASLSFLRGRKQVAVQSEPAAVLNALTGAVIVANSDNRISYANSAAEQFFAVSTSLLIGQKIQNLLPPDSPLIMLIEQARETDSPVSEYEVLIHSPKIGEQFVGVDASPVVEQPGAVVVALHQQTIARKIGSQISRQRTVRSVTAMASLLAHEVKNPLSGIRGAAQLLSRGAEESDRELTSLICDETDRICDLIDRIDVFADRRPVERDEVNIHQVLKHVRKIAQAGFGRNIRFKEEYDPSLPPVYGHRDQLIQVFLNLIKNGCEAAPEIGGEIVLTTSYQHGVRFAVPGTNEILRLPLVIGIIDNGGGIPDEIRANLFDPFLTTKPKGSGLGLALVAKIISDHGGVIEHDTRPGRTEFRVSLPMSPRPSPVPDDEENTPLMAQSTILVADDDRSIRTVLTQALARAGYEVKTSSNAATLWRWVAAGEGDLVITDVVMPDENGLDLIPRIKHIRPDLKIIVMSAQNTLLTAVKATERGAFEYLPKPFDLDELVRVVQRALEARSNAKVEGDELPEDGGIRLIGRSPAMQEIYRTVARLMNTDLTVMINGESGTGKELVARALHEYGRRRNGPFIAVNMAAIPRELIESELFGHEKGAFTGATARTAGRFEQAAGGTLFLDEIGDMPIEAQTRLLRVLQEGEFTTVGGRTPVRANVRIVAATHRDLSQALRQGMFREDLYYRLNVVPLRLPPLRDRKVDIPQLVNHFLAQAVEEGLPSKTIDPEAIEKLKEYDWPGNIRELENLIRRLIALYSEEVIGYETVQIELNSHGRKAGGEADETSDNLSGAVERHIREYFRAHGDSLPAAGVYERVLHEVERPLISICLEATRGNQIKAAALLGLNRNTLRKKIRELDIPVVRGVN